jgi:hypothetical protein
MLLVDPAQEALHIPLREILEAPESLLLHRLR